MVRGIYYIGVDTQSFALRQPAEPIHREIYSSLKISTEVMKPVKTWHELST